MASSEEIMRYLFKNIQKISSREMLKKKTKKDNSGNIPVGVPSKIFEEKHANARNCSNI